LTATSADGCCTKWWFVAVVRLGEGLGGVAERVAEEVDGVALEAEPDMGVHRRGHSDVGMAEEFLDHDEFDALLQEQRCRRVPEIVKPDAAEGVAVGASVGVISEGGSVIAGAMSIAGAGAAAVTEGAETASAPKAATRSGAKAAESEAASTANTGSRSEGADRGSSQKAPGGQKGPGVSVRNVKMALGGAGMSVDHFDVVHVPEIKTADGLLAYGYSPHPGGHRNWVLRLVP